MERSKKMIIMSHCILNSNSKVEGLSGYKGVISEVINLVIDRGIGIIQLPCPEMIMYGIKRWGHVKEQFDTPFYRQNCRKMIVHIVNQIIDYRDNGYKILGVIGIDGSPSCGVNKTCSSNWGGELSKNKQLMDTINNIEWIKESGVLIDELKKCFEENDLDIPFIAVDEMNINDNINEIRQFLNRRE